MKSSPAPSSSEKSGPVASDASLAGHGVKSKAKLPPVLALLRPKQWSKNAVCLAGAFFSGHIEFRSDLRALAAAGGFCAAAAFVYVINDILDRERDRAHPRKRFRPIAAGQVSVPQALVIAAIMLAIAIAIGIFLGSGILFILGSYALLNILYSAGLKHLSLVEATVVAAGFILRVYAGTVAVGVVPSAWLLLCTLFLSLFLAFGKRRAELNAAGGTLVSSRSVLSKYEVGDGIVTERRSVIQEYENPRQDVTATRAVLHKYNIAMLDRFCNICATLTIATYALFTVLGHPESRALVITNPPVVMGIFRYLLLVERYSEGEAPDVILLKDWPIQLAIAIWAVLYIAVTYFGLQIDVQ